MLMDETATPTTASSTAATSPPATNHTDSAIFEDIDNLSPITAVKASNAITGFPGFSSPIVFATPDLNPSGGSYSKRFQSHPLSSKDICQRGSRGKKIECYSEDTAKTEIQSTASFMQFTQKECDDGSKEDQFSGPSLRFNKYLVDAVGVDHGETNCSASCDLKQLNQCPDTKTKSEGNRSLRQDGENAMVTFAGITQLELHDNQENPSFNEKPVEKDASNEGNELQSSSKDQRSEHKNITDGVSEFPVQPRHSIFGYKHGSNASGEASHGKRENEGQGSHGLQRRRLFFEEADHHVVGNTLSLWNPSNSETRRSPASPVDFETHEPTVSQKTETYSKIANSNQPTSTISFKRCSNSKSTVSRPSGIGLHLNSIIGSNKFVSVGKGTTSNEKGFLDLQGEKSLSCSGYPLESVNNDSISLKIGGRSSTNSQNEEGSDSHCPEYGSLNDSALLMQSDNQATSSGKRKFALEQACGFEEWSQSTSKKKSRRAASSDSDGCKRCKCKKTKCLKLYCDCFAAGVYCSEFCFCEGCFNRPDYVDTVLQVRQQIESRNPLAFAPKVVERAIGSHVETIMEAVSDTTPPSARHKRGCNCKKSMCIKKYCECFQNNVGCSSECRCQGCENIYGKKEGACDENVEMVAYQDCFLPSEPYYSHSITPTTLLFQLSNHQKESKFTAPRFVSSPEPDHSSTPNYQGSLGTTDDGDAMDVNTPTYDGLAEVDNSNKLLKSQEHRPLQSGYLSSVSSLDRCESSFTTPVGQLGSAKLFKTDSEKLDNNHEDDTPEILKDPIDAVKINSPNKKRVSPPRTNTVKVTSPNKKRVSPPRIGGLRQLSSFSSAGMTRGRKFILRALPSFPALTPCSDDKDSTNQNGKS